jgi:8-oxo-dGTP pyrophosphatase MutT (NUDIX family)
MRDRLPQAEFEWIFSRVPRLTVEVVIASPERGVLLQLRDREPCKGTWSLPGGTVRFGEPVVGAVKRVALDELELDVTVGESLGHIEYPSHYNNGLDSPVGLAFRAAIVSGPQPPRGCQWFTTLPDSMHDEQQEFLVEHVPEVHDVSERLRRQR